MTQVIWLDPENRFVPVLGRQIGHRELQRVMRGGRGIGIRAANPTMNDYALFLDSQRYLKPHHFIIGIRKSTTLLLYYYKKRANLRLVPRPSLAQFRSSYRAMSAVNYPPPFAALLNAESLEIQPNTGGYVKYIRELDRIYADEEKFQQLLESRGSDIAYRVNELRFTDCANDLITGISVLNPGKVGSEFFMTRGHLHQRADRPETYYCLSGHGILLMEDLEGRVEAAEMRPGSLIYVPPFWVHRSVNIGSEIFATLFSYPADAGQNFEIVRKAGGFKLLVVDDEDKGWKLVPNPRYSVRARAEIEAYTLVG